MPTTGTSRGSKLGSFDNGVSGGMVAEGSIGMGEMKNRREHGAGGG